MELKSEMSVSCSGRLLGTNSGPLEEQQVLSAPKPSLQPLDQRFKDIYEKAQSHMKNLKMQ